MLLSNTFLPTNAIQAKPNGCTCYSTINNQHKEFLQAYTYIDLIRDSFLIYANNSYNIFHHQAHHTTERITLPGLSLQRTPKSLNFNLKYLNHYLIIFSKNLNMSFHIPILVLIII
jgi:hypothetical protein